MKRTSSAIQIIWRLKTNYLLKNIWRFMKNFNDNRWWTQSKEGLMMLQAEIVSLTRILDNKGKVLIFYKEKLGPTTRLCLRLKEKEEATVPSRRRMKEVHWTCPHYIKMRLAACAHAKNLLRSINSTDILYPNLTSVCCYFPWSTTGLVTSRQRFVLYCAAFGSSFQAYWFSTQSDFSMVTTRCTWKE